MTRKTTGKARGGAKRRTRAAGGAKPRRATGARRKTGTARRRGRAGRGRALWGGLARWAATVLIWAALLLVAAFGWYAHDLPDIAGLDGAVRRPSVTLLAADGSLLATYGDLYGAPARVEELPPHLLQAVLAAEDRRFYEHHGVDPAGIARALFVNLREGGIRQGGSTLTQQLAKNLFLGPERSLGRKIRETLLALRLERRFSKDQILTIYLNRVYLGAGTWGVDAAARRYFGKPAAELDLYESAMIAGLLKAPSRYNPARNRDLANRRAALVLDAMVEAGFIDAAEARRAKGRKGAGVRRAGAALQRYFADWVLDRVRGYLGYVETDLVVRTTLDPRLQRLAEAQTAAHLKQAARAKVGQAALVAMTPDGAVRAMVGGRDYGASQFNRATQALRQPGSAFKPVVYLAALESGLGPTSPFVDAPVVIDGWRPRNAGGRYYGEVTLREAVTRSLNSVAVRVTEKIGRAKVIAAARRLGITSPLKPLPSLALGANEVSPLELTAAYAVFANDGVGVWPHGIAEIRDGKGKLLHRREGSGPGRLVAPAEVRAMNDVLRSVIAWGTGRAAKIGRPAAGKTGTSQDFRDAWFIGYTPDLVAGVWVGNDDGKPMRGVTGGGLPARLWRDFMREAHENLPPRPLPGVAGGGAAADSPIQQGRAAAD